MKDIDLNALLHRLQENEEIARKFAAVETAILSILKFRDLFEVLLTEIRERFRVPYVWISMIENSDLQSLISSLASSEMLRERMSVIDRRSFRDLVGSTMTPVLVNQNLKPYFKLLPQKKKYFIKSMAMAPLSLDGEIIGSLNQADFSPERFSPGIDTSLLEQLAVKVSLCLSNVTAHEKLRYMAFHDPLTGLLNRRVMETVLQREFNRARRYKSPLSVVFIDLNDFKAVNDTYGHDCGDDLLQFLGSNLVKMSRDSDVVARFAGDEFVLILPETTAENAEHLMERVCNYLKATPLKVGAKEITCTISYGVACSRDPLLRDPAALLKAADERLYEAKARLKAKPKKRRKNEGPP
ncbi:MAG: sensor domain-containing diguanylate cyclase [Desulfobacteraceae bacterium]|jgi:diguanylate cyclase (GGDEF)-like protein